jgi:thioredoxin 1
MTFNTWTWLNFFLVIINQQLAMPTSFQDLIKSEKPVLVDFHATWCGPCKMMTPILQELKKDVGENLTIIKVDIDQQPGIARTYNVQSVPTLALFRNGQLKWRQSGVIPAAQIKRAIQPHL